MGFSPSPGALSRHRLQAISLPHWLLLAIFASLIIIHLTLLERWSTANLLEAGLLPWSATLYAVWLRGGLPTIRIRLLPGVLGTALMASILTKIALLPQPQDVLLVYPIAITLGLLLIITGFRGLWQYRLALLVLFILSIVRVKPLPSWLLDLSLPTAKFSAYLMWYGGIDVAQQGTLIALDGGVVNVDLGCSGIVLITHLLCIATAFLLLFPSSRLQKCTIPAIAFALGFGINAIRVMIMALLVAQGNDAGFEYWHSGGGSQLFSVIGMGLLLLLFAFWTPPSATPATPEEVTHAE